MNGTIALVLAESLPTMECGRTNRRPVVAARPVTEPSADDVAQAMRRCAKTHT